MAHDIDIVRLSAELASEQPARDANADRERARVAVRRVEHHGVYVRIWLDVPDAWRTQHQLPGQYVTVRLGDSRHRFLVIANAPQSSRNDGFELLVEPNEDLEPILSELRVGTTVVASPPEGPGFPTRVADTVYLFATGSGIAGLRSVLQMWADSTPPNKVVLFYEEAPGSPHSYRDELETWQAEGWLELHLSTASPEDDHIDASIRERSPIELASDSLLCGAPTMIAAVTEVLLSRGVDAESVHTNI